MLYQGVANGSPTAFPTLPTLPPTLSTTQSNVVIKFTSGCQFFQRLFSAFNAEYIQDFSNIKQSMSTNVRIGTNQIMPRPTDTTVRLRCFVRPVDVLPMGTSVSKPIGPRLKPANPSIPNILRSVLPVANVKNVTACYVASKRSEPIGVGFKPANPLIPNILRSVLPVANVKNVTACYVASKRSEPIGVGFGNADAATNRSTSIIIDVSYKWKRRQLIDGAINDVDGSMTGSWQGVCRPSSPTTLLPLIATSRRCKTMPRSGHLCTSSLTLRVCRSRDITYPIWWWLKRKTTIVPCRSRVRTLSFISWNG